MCWISKFIMLRKEKAKINYLDAFSVTSEATPFTCQGSYIAKSVKSR